PGGVRRGRERDVVEVECSGGRERRRVVLSDRHAVGSRHRGEVEPGHATGPDAVEPELTAPVVGAHAGGAELEQVPAAGNEACVDLCGDERAAGPVTADLQPAA